MCTQHSKRIFLAWKVQETHLRVVLSFLALFLSSKLFFFKIWHPFHSFIYYYNWSLFLAWEKFLQGCHHTHIWNCFPLMFTMIRELLLWAQKYYVISNETMCTYWLAYRFRELPILTSKYLLKKPEALNFRSKYFSPNAHGWGFYIQKDSIILCVLKCICKCFWKSSKLAEKCLQ